MTTEQKGADGGQAFPCSFTRLNNYNEVVERSFQNGMTLRDYMAAKALVAQGRCNEHPTDIRIRAKFAYAMADAMLAARGQP